MGMNPDYLSRSRYTDYGTADSSFEESRCKRQDDIKVDLKIEWKSVDSIHLAEDRDNERAVLNKVLNLRVHFYGHKTPTHAVQQELLPLP